MRLAKYSLMALIVSMTTSGCAAYRTATQGVTSEPEAVTLPPRHAHEYHPPNGYEHQVPEPVTDPSDLRRAPIQPPPVPPAFGISRVKSVGFIRDLGTRVSGPLRSVQPVLSAERVTSAPTKPCAEDDCSSEPGNRKSGGLKKLMDKSRSIGCLQKKHTQPAATCSEVPERGQCSACPEAEAGLRRAMCGEPSRNGLPGLIRPHEGQSRRMVVPRSGCSDGCGVVAPAIAGCSQLPSLDGLQRPCLSDSMSDPFLDAPVQRAPKWPQTSPSPVSPAPSQLPFAAPLAQPADAVPRHVVPDPPSTDDADRQSESLPLWPKLEGDQRVRAAQASLQNRSPSRELAASSGDVQLPQIIPRPMQ